MSRDTRATTVVSQPPRLSTSLVSARLTRSHDSCTASSASASEPSMRYATTGWLVDSFGVHWTLSVEPA